MHRDRRPAAVGAFAAATAAANDLTLAGCSMAVVHRTWMDALRLGMDGLLSQLDSGMVSESCPVSVVVVLVVTASVSG